MREYSEHDRPVAQNRVFTYVLCECESALADASSVGGSYEFSERECHGTGMTDECDKWHVGVYHSLPCILLTPNNSLLSKRSPGSPGRNTPTTAGRSSWWRGRVDKEPVCILLTLKGLPSTRPLVALGKNTPNAVSCSSSWNTADIYVVCVREPGKRVDRS